MRGGVPFHRIGSAGRFETRLDGTLRPDGQRGEAAPFAGLSKYLDLKLVSRLEFASGAVATRSEPSRTP